MQRDNSDTAQAVSFCLAVGHLYRTIGMDRYQPSNGVIMGLPSGVIMGFPSGVITGLTKRRHYWPHAKRRHYWAHAKRCHYWAHQAASLLASRQAVSCYWPRAKRCRVTGLAPSGVNTGLAKRDKYPSPY